MSVELIVYPREIDGAVVRKVKDYWIKNAPHNLLNYFGDLQICRSDGRVVADSDILQIGSVFTLKFSHENTITIFKGEIENESMDDVEDYVSNATKLGFRYAIESYMGRVEHELQAMLVVAAGLAACHDGVVVNEGPVVIAGLRDGVFTEAEILAIAAGSSIST